VLIQSQPGAARASTLAGVDIQRVAPQVIAIEFAQVEVPHEDVEAFLHRVRSLQVSSYHRCELDRIGEMRDLKNKMWKYGSFGGTERSLTSATYFDTSKAGYVT
jgi:hypothetical protein